MSPLTFTVCGLIHHPIFQQCTEAATYLHKEYNSEYYINIFYEVPRDFYTRRRKMLEEQQIEDETMEVIVIPGDGSNIISGAAFIKYIQMQTCFRIISIAPSEVDSYEKMALISWKKFLRERGNSYCWMEITIGNVAQGRITFELFSQIVPRTCNNFWHLCYGDLGSVIPREDEEDNNNNNNNNNKEKTSPQPIQLSYKSSTFFRILKGAWIMGGDISHEHTGNSGYSCYGRYFPNESYAISHDNAGILGMCNDSEDTNASAFYITMKPMSWMNGKYIAFGQVIDGMQVVEAIHNVEVKHNQSPREVIMISDCGIIDLTD